MNIKNIIVILVVLMFVSTAALAKGFGGAHFSSPHISSHYSMEDEAAPKSAGHVEEEEPEAPPPRRPVTVYRAKSTGVTQYQSTPGVSTHWSWWPFYSSPQQHFDGSAPTATPTPRG